MTDFIQQYFLEPIQTGSGYNPVNTTVFAIALIIAVYVLIKVLKKMKIKTDEGLWYDLLPFVFLGGVLRALEDIHFLPNHWIFVTPGIYFLVFAIAFGSMLFSKYSGIRITRWVGILLLALSGAAALANVHRWPEFVMILGMSLGIVALAYFAFGRLKSKLLKGKNWQVLFGHTLDACASFMAVGVVGGYTEQHVVPSAIFSVLPLWCFIPIKVFIILGALYVIDKETKKEWNWMLKFTILVLGLGPGTRDAVTVLIGS